MKTNTLQKTIHHYGLYQFQQRLTNRFENEQRYYMDHNEENKQKYINFQINPNQLIKYQTDLIKDQLHIIVYECGRGNYIKSGQYVNYHRRIYYNGDQNILECSSVTCRYGDNSNPQCTQLIFSMAKQDFTARVHMNKKYAQQLLKIYPKNKITVLQIKVVSISDYPLSNKFIDFMLFHNGIVKDAMDGDSAYCNRDFQTSLSCYQCAIEKISSQYYTQNLITNKKSLTKQQKYYSSYYYQNKQNTKQQRKQKQKNRQITQQIQSLSNKIILKGIEIALLTQQYWKVIKWSYPLAQTTQYQNNYKLLLMRASAYIELNEYDYALNDLSRIKNNYVNFQNIQELINKAIDKKRQHMQQTNRLNKQIL